MIPDLPPPSYTNKGIRDSSGLSAYLDAKAPYMHPFWIRLQRAWEKADCYYDVVQWIVESYNSAAVATPHWARLTFNDPDDPEYIPTPVYDEFSPPIENEAARLGKPDYKAYVRPEGERPNVTVRQGAKMAERVLEGQLQEMGWDQIQERGLIHMPLYGGWWLESRWDVSWEETVKVGSPTAVKCSRCDAAFANPRIPMAHGEATVARAPWAATRELAPDSRGGMRAQYNLQACPFCSPEEPTPTPTFEDGQAGPMATPDGMPTMGAPQAPPPQPLGPAPLQPFQPVDDEVKQTDPFGRPLGIDVPLGKWKLITRHPSEVFPENLGIEVYPESMTEWLVVHIESREWCWNRFDGIEDLQPESPWELMKFHTIAGERAIYYGSDRGTKIFEDHVRVWEYNRKPWREPTKMGWCGQCGQDSRVVKGGCQDCGGNLIGIETKMVMNRGRSITKVGDRIVLDGDFMIESKTNPGKLIPRVHLDYVPFKIRRGGKMMHGGSFSDQLFDVQDNVNMKWAQIQNAREAMGSPKWLVEEGMQFDFNSVGNAGAQWVYTANPANPAVVPKEIGNTLLNAEVYQELEQDLAYIQRTTGQREVDTGTVPPGVTAALAIQYLSEQSGERRRPRIRRIREMLKRVWSHGLLLCHELVREPRTLWNRLEDGSWKQSTWKGLDLMGQTDVQIDPEPDKESPLVKNQAVADGLKTGLFDMQDPNVRRTLAKEQGIDSAVYDQQNLQDDCAGREFRLFMDAGRPPVVDEDLDDDKAHYERHGTDCMGDEWRDLEDAAGWDDVLPYLTGWQQAIFGSQQQDPTTGQMIQTPGLAQAMAQDPSLPQSQEMIVYLGWQQILAEKGVMPQDQKKVQALKAVLRFRAHIAAHKMAMQADQMQAQAGQAPVQAPQGTPQQAGM